MSVTLRVALAKRRTNIKAIADEANLAWKTVSKAADGLPPDIEVRTLERIVEAVNSICDGDPGCSEPPLRLVLELMEGSEATE